MFSTLNQRVSDTRELREQIRGEIVRVAGGENRSRRRGKKKDTQGKNREGGKIRKMEKDQSLE